VSSRHFQVHRFLSDVPTRRKTAATFSRTTGQLFALCPMRDFSRLARRVPHLEKIVAAALAHPATGLAAHMRHEGYTGGPPIAFSPSLSYFFYCIPTTPRA